MGGAALEPGRLVLVLPILPPPNCVVLDKATRVSVSHICQHSAGIPGWLVTGSSSHTQEDSSQQGALDNMSSLLLWGPVRRTQPFPLLCEARVTELLPAGCPCPAASPQTLTCKVRPSPKISPSGHLLRQG